MDESKVVHTTAYPAGLGSLNSPAAVGEYLGKSVASLSQMRYTGTGPRFVRVGRLIRYTGSDVEQWIAANTHNSTTDAA
jgi:predicted DNA-binding transcriptional regulator AlpA